MRLRILGFSLLIACLGPATVSAQATRTAAIPQQPAEIVSMTALPAEIRTALGEMADRGGPFAPGCVSLHGEPHSRFAGARVGAQTARVTIERGGIAHFFDQRDFKKIDGHWVALPDETIPKAPPAPLARN
jgi:hypothetical protein